MDTIRRILHPTDFSAPSAAALRIACSLAENYGAELSLLYVWDPQVATGDEGHPHVPANSLEEALAWLDAIDVRASTVRVFRHLIVGEPVDEIVRQAKEESSDLIVMGTHGRTGLKRLLLGSVAEGVLRRGPCPVLTVRDTPRTDHVERAALKREAVRA